VARVRLGWGTSKHSKSDSCLVPGSVSKSDRCLVPGSVSFNVSLGGGCRIGLKQAEHRSQSQTVQRAPTLPTAISLLHLSQS
jgi:hypothetical protein